MLRKLWRMRRVHVLVVVVVALVLYLVVLGKLVVDYDHASGEVEGKDKSRRRRSTRAATRKREGSRICLLPECIDKVAATIARPFPDRSDKAWENQVTATTTTTTTIREGRDNHYKHYGLLLVKVPTAASSTAAGVALRISRLHGNIPVKYDHQLPSIQEYGNRHPTLSFLFASVSDPAIRALDFAFYEQTRLQQPQDERFEDVIYQSLVTADRQGTAAKSQGRGGLQLRYTSLKEIPRDSAWSKTHPTSVQNPNRIHTHVQHVIENYDFLLVVERMDESLVALALTMGIDVGDVLVTSSSSLLGGLPSSSSGRNNQYFPFAGRGPSGRRDPTRCVARIQPFSTPATERLFNSDEWRAMNYGDYVLHAAANRCLDLTIQQLGQEKFQQALATYRRLQAEAVQVCNQRIHLPCSSKGELQYKLASQNCYQGDAGCGYACIDELLRNDTKKAVS